jgi:hypothetical protein
LAKTESRSATIRLPRPVYELARCAAEEQSQGDKRISLNDFFVTAISAYLKMYRRKQIDSAFAGMAEDKDYQRESKLLLAEFEHSDWEALRLGERNLEGKSTHARRSAR